jgi:hypothetical protein
MKFRPIHGLAGLLLGAALACGPSIIKAPLSVPQADTGRIYPAQPAKVAVVVKDARPADAILSAGIVGPNGDKGEGIFLAYQTETPEQMTQLMQDSAKAGLAAFGFADGPAYTLEVHLKDSRIDMTRYSGFSPMNCIGYCHLETVLKTPDGQAKTRTFKLAYFENTTPMMSMKEVAKEAVSRIYHQAVVEAVVTTLQDQFPGAAEPAALERVLTAAKTSTEQVTARELVFMLGLTAKGHAPTQNGLVELYQTSKTQRVRQGALEAVGMLGVTAQAADLQAMLSGAKKYPDWDMTDMEEVWYVLKALHLLGVKDLSGKIPAGEMKGGARLGALVEFLRSGTIPPLTAQEADLLAKARKG